MTHTRLSKVCRHGLRQGGWLLTLLCVSAFPVYAEEAGAETVPLPDDKPPTVAPPPSAEKSVKLDAPKRGKRKPVLEKSPDTKTQLESKPVTPEPLPSAAPADPAPPAPIPVVVSPPAPAPIKPPLSLEPAGELVPLAAEKPVLPPATGARETKFIVAEKSDETSSLALTVETPQLKPGEKAVFSLYGPELFLRSANAQYVLRDEWGRDVLRGTIRVVDLPYTDDKPRQIILAVPVPLSQTHTLELSLSGTDGKQIQLRASFAIPQQKTWESWISLVASPPADSSDTGWASLRSLGISGGMQYRIHPARREAWRKGHAAFYVENIARQWLSRYHTEPGAWATALEQMAKENNSASSLSRVPSFNAPLFAENFAKELKRHADVYAKDPPLFYSLASEPSVTRLAAAADFDFTPANITEFQRWLERDVYGTIKALNTAWGTHFKAWGDVIPMTTDEVRTRFNDGEMNAGPWIDFRDFQDYTFSKILKDGGDYIRRYDASAKVGITGAMGAFAFGGWDWSRLSQSLDVVECYDIGGARALWRDLAPGKPALAIIPLFDAQTADANETTRTLWSLALEGGPRGAVLWDDAPGSDGGGARALLDGEGKPTAIADALRPALNALNGEAGALLAHSERIHDGIAVLYSPASVRMHWLLEANRLHGDTWLQAWGADTSAERRQSPQLRLRESWGKLLDDLGLGWRFISSAQIENKDILNPELRIKTLVLPQSIALSDREAEVLKTFVQGGGKIVADAVCGRFDEHGRKRDKPALDGLLKLDTSAEPLAPQAMNPLETIVAFNIQHATQTDADTYTKEFLSHLPPVYSDRPKRIGLNSVTFGLEYRRSPVLASSKAGVFLNLDLTDYLRWRLHPDDPRAKTARDVLAHAVFSERLNECLIDWSKSKVPLGTQAVWLQRRGGGATARVLALRRNLQNRLHELGDEADGNWGFEKNDPFTLVLRAPATVIALNGTGGAAPTKNIDGQLNSITPRVFVVNTRPSHPPKVSAAQRCRLGDTISIEVKSAETSSALFSLRLIAPDGTGRPYHALTRYCGDGSLSIQIPIAFSEPEGAWKLVVRDLGQGTETTTVITMAR